MAKYEDKYEKNRDIEADTPIKTIISTAKLGLVLIGLLGIAVQMFQDDGWLKHLLSKMYNSSLGIYSFLVAGVFLFVINKIITDNTTGKASKRGNLPFHVMMIVGAIFIYRLITLGTF